MAELWGENVGAILGEGQFHIGEHRTGSTDFGDVGHIMPAVHPYLGGAKGIGHGNDYLLVDHEKVYVSSAKMLAMTAIDLLYEDAAKAKEIIAESRPKMTKEEYLAFQRALNGTEHFQADT